MFDTRHIHKNSAYRKWERQAKVHVDVGHEVVKSVAKGHVQYERAHFVNFLSDSKTQHRLCHPSNSLVPNDTHFSMDEAQQRVPLCINIHVLASKKGSLRSKPSTCWHWLLRTDSSLFFILMTRVPKLCWQIACTSYQHNAIRLSVVVMNHF